MRSYLHLSIWIYYSWSLGVNTIIIRLCEHNISVWRGIHSPRRLCLYSVSCWARNTWRLWRNSISIKRSVQATRTLTIYSLRVKVWLKSVSSKISCLCLWWITRSIVSVSYKSSRLYLGWGVSWPIIIEWKWNIIIIVIIIIITIETII